MRRRRKKGTGNPQVTETYIGQDTRFEGTIVAQGPLRIDGQVKGTIHGESDVFVGKSGRVEAEVSAVNLILAGTLVGTTRVSGRLELLASGRLQGDTTVQTLIVEDGGLLHGKLEMGIDAKEATSAAATTKAQAG